MDSMPKFDYWIFQTVPGEICIRHHVISTEETFQFSGLTGVFLTIFLSIMYVFGSHTARKHIFHTFWITHRLFVVVIALTVVHGTAAMIQSPSFHLFTAGPIVIYMFNWLISLRSRGVELKILNVEILPSGTILHLVPFGSGKFFFIHLDVLHLCFKLPSTVAFYSGQYLRLACEEISYREFHPFTITSAPYERVLSCHIRAVGPWTRSLKDIFATAATENKPCPKVSDL